MSSQYRKPSSKRFRPRVPLDQRKRIVKACTSCRTRKRRCVLVSPGRCQNCSKTNSSCIFETEENAPATSTTSRPFGERIVHEDVVAKFNRLYPEINLKPDHSIVLMEILMSSIRGSDAGQPLTTATRSSPQTLGRHDALAHEDFLFSASEAVCQTERPDFSDDTSSSYFTLEASAAYDNCLIMEILKEFPSPAEADLLISAFFSYVEANFYYFDKTTFCSQLSSLYKSGLSLSAADHKFICLAVTVFAMGSQFAHLHEFENLSTAEGTDIEQTGIPGARFFSYAQRLIPRIIAYPSLEGVLSCLLTALYVLPNHNTNTCYTYLGLALRIAICLGLHQKPDDTGLPPSLSETRNRIFWTTYSIERRIAISLGYPETLQGKDIDCALPERQADLDPPGSWQVDRLLAYTKLTLLLNKSIQFRPMDKRATEEIRSQLLAWKDGLPAELTALDGPTVRLNVHLQLHYCMIWTYISRASLISKVRSFLSKRKHDIDDISVCPEIEELSQRCVEHAEQIIDLVDLLRNRRQLGRFSHTDFHSCSSATIIILLESILQPRLMSYSRVSKAMDALHFMACGSDFARSTLKHVDNFQAAVNRALATMSHQGGTYVDDNGVFDLPKEYSLASRFEQLHARDEGLQCSVKARPPCDTTLCDRNPQEPATYQPDYQVTDGVFLDDVGNLLEDCSTVDLHMLGFDGLFSEGGTFNYNDR
ncbi:fungal-specific transcription factor domain-containing protein [Aspergillus ambiguus]|uniref:transcription factor domain-containing protein n=1 Tax=Aspergillus ambiguus TaxID=176160 RepID=UPI003CCDADDD